MNAEEIETRLVAEFGYPPHAAQAVAEKVVALTPIVRPAFEQWWTNGRLPTLAVADYSAERLMREHGMNPVAALLTLDWLVREPEKASASLRKGHDRIR